MKLVIVNLTSGGLSGGYRKYLQKLIPLLQEQPDIDEISVFLPPWTEECFNLDTSNYQTWPKSDYKENFVYLKSQIQEASPDVVFIPTSRYLDFDSIPTVVMIRNMEPMRISFTENPIKEAIKNLVRAHSAKRASFRAVRIIAVSKYVKKFLITQWRINSENIGVVYHGVELTNGAIFGKIPAHLNNLHNEKFIFTAGSIRPARGLEDLLSAFALVCRDEENAKLVIAGSEDPGMRKYKSKLDAMIEKLGIARSVIWTGSLTDREISWCYCNCDVFVMTSRAEACPNIALEAMAHGCVCISTETPPMPEFFRDVAVYYPSRDRKMLCETIQKVLSWDSNWRNKIAQRAKHRASLFSWDICAQRTVEELKLAIENFTRSKKQ